MTVRLASHSDASPSGTTQDTRTLSQSPSSPDADATKSHGRSGSDEVNEKERDNPSKYSFQNVSEL
ncbi:hypothetical protein AZE42_04461 [Rhizopogon vesiculosus]|uniref:Uncharacterized protein n=1 Tax=Rhizopogon vesiculosus TaxID=180088 RepID=A0A1J8QHA2_9AGAM|nr:hypothetical protein AZE42_04461 [Rhizopogon vesiculosus]